MLEYAWSGDERVGLAPGPGQHAEEPAGVATLRFRAASTEVTYQLAVDLVIPMLGLLKRKAEKVIMDTALKELKKRVEG